MKYSVITLLIIFAFSIPAILHYQSSSSRTRLNAISVLTPDVTLPISIKEMEEDQKNELSMSSILHNRRFVYFSSMLDNYFDYFDLDYLFVNARNIRYFYINSVGLFYLIEVPFFLYGLYILAKRRLQSDLLILSLLLIGPIPAMITLGSPFPHRALLLILGIQLIIAFGALNFIKNIFSKTNQKPLFLVIILIYLLNITFFVHQYFIHSPQEFTSETDNGAWFSTVREAIPKVNSLSNQYQKVVFTWSQGKLVPAVYFLFYNLIDPHVLQEKAAKWTNETPSYRQIYDSIRNIEFRPINWEQDKDLKNTLFIGYKSEFSTDVKVIDKTYLPNGKEHFVFVENQ